MKAVRPHRPAVLTATLLALVSLTLGACGSGGGSAGSPSGTDKAAEPSGSDAGEDLTEALEAGTPTDTVDVPSEDGATTIEAYAAGGSSYEAADPAELAQLLAIVGTDADGYLTSDTVVVRTSAADATLLCKTADGLDISTYTVIPVLPDGTGVDCG